jgi:hypothetical protein
VATGERPKTTVPTQGLFMLNNSMVMAAAEATAKRILTETSSHSIDTLDARIDRMYELIVGAQPTDNERQALRSYLERASVRLKPSNKTEVAAGLVPATRAGATDETTRGWATDESDVRALALACHAVFASSRFQFLE